METLSKKQEKFLNFLAHQSIDIDLQYAFEANPEQSFEDFEEEVTTLIHQTEVIYYSTAVEFLRLNDASLRESLGLASEMGYTPENLSSETLATILKQQMLFDEWAEIREEIQEEWENLFD